MAKFQETLTTPISPPSHQVPLALVFGHQLTADFHGCDPRVLDDVVAVRAAMLEAARLAGATIVGDHVHRFDPIGVSGVVIISESHLAIHTWPEFGFAALDLFTCGDVLKPDPALRYLERVFGAQRAEVQAIQRGHGANKAAEPDRDWVHVETVGQGRKLQLQLEGPWMFDAKETLPGLEGVEQRVQIGAFKEFGRGLVIDGQVQLAEGADAEYTRALVFPAALRSVSRKRWLIVGGGDGAAAREALRFEDTEEVIVVDVSRTVVEQTQKLIPSFWGESIRDPRLRLELGDGLALMRQLAHRDERFDLIVFDLTDPSPATSEARLYSTDTYKLASRLLAIEGVFVTQLQELSSLEWENHRAHVGKLREAFRNVSSYRKHIDFFGYQQSFAMASNSLAPWSPVPAEPIEPWLSRFYRGDWSTHWSQAVHVALFALPKSLEAKLAAPPKPPIPEARSLTREELEALPLDAYTEVRHAGPMGLGLFATRLIPQGTRWWRAGQDNVLNVSRAQYDILLRSELERSEPSRKILEAIQMFGYINDETNQVVVAIDNSRFVNHSDTPNSDCAPEDPNNVAMANRDIQPGEEIVEDYRTYSMNTWDMPDEPYLR